MKLFIALAAAAIATTPLIAAAPAKAFAPGIDCNAYKNMPRNFYQQCKQSKKKIQFDVDCMVNDFERDMTYHAESRKFYNVTPDGLELKPGMMEEYKAFMRERNSNRQTEITDKGWTHRRQTDCGDGKDMKQEFELNDRVWLDHFSENREVAQIYMNSKTQYNDNSTNYNGNVNYGTNNGSMQNNRYNGDVNNNVYQAPVRNSQCDFSAPNSKQNNFFGC